jgi:lipoprotein-anchoring transpeptidase ErfK/SrfK
MFAIARLMRKTIITIMTVALVGAAGCSRDEARQRTQTAVDTASQAAEDALNAAVPIRGQDDPAAQERERFDDGWRNLDAFRDTRLAQRRDQAANVNIQFAPDGKESLEGQTPQTINDAPVVVPLKGDVSGPSVLKTQVYLDRANFSVGVIDGRWGKNTAIALWWYQRSRGINAPEPGALDEQTFRTLASASGGEPPLIQHTLTSNDVKGPFVPIPEDVYEKEKLDCLCYQSVLEQLAERFHTTEGLLERLNPDVNFSTAGAGTPVWVPNVRPPVTQDRPDIARVQVSIRGNTFSAFDANDNLIFHAPTTLGSQYDPSPRETLEVVKVAFDPHFHYQPKLFHHVDDAEPEAHLNPGPNSPVGVVWIALSKRHYGIHGTNAPETIGYASSAGCVRLANWDAREVAHRISPKVKIEFVDTRGGVPKGVGT